MPFTLRMLAYVVATADTGSVTEAARRLCVSQPSVSSAIARVEAYLGTDVFVRHHAKGMTATVAGQHFLNEARHLLNHAADFERDVSALNSNVSGEIIVGSFLTLATHYMPRILQEFSKQAPNINVRLVEGHQQDMLDGVASGQMEIALAYAYGVPREIAGDLLAELPPYVLVSVDHPLADRKDISLKEVAGEPFILLDLPHSRDYFFSLFAHCRITPRIAYRSQSSELIRGLVSYGHGYTIHNAVPKRNVSYNGSQVVALRIREPLQAAQVMCLHLRRQNLRPAVASFARYLKYAFSSQEILDRI